MEPHALFDELAKLSADARQELIVTFDLAAAHCSERIDELVEGDRRHELEHRRRLYLNLAQQLRDVRTP